MPGPLTLTDLAELGYAPKHFRKPKPKKSLPPGTVNFADRLAFKLAIDNTDVPAMRELLIKHGQCNNATSDSQILEIINLVRGKNHES